ncbi:MAG: CocE/NonD family hydrolase [Actinomycetota bacterium]
MSSSSTLSVERHLRVPMRDGILLATDVYRPSGPGSFPTLLARTPYDKNAEGPSPLTIRAASAGYAVITQDVRGRYSSEGAFRPFHSERDDGYDTLDWIASQPWSNGNVGMFGGSYVGVTQWQAAISGHSALRAIVPSVTAGNYHNGWTYQGGAFAHQFNVAWSLSSLGPADAQRIQGKLSADYFELVDRRDHMMNDFKRLPLAGRPLFSTHVPYFEEWLQHPTYDSFWQAVDVAPHYSALSVPSLNTGGWYDIFSRGTTENFVGMRTSGPTAAADATHLLMGPWNHSGVSRGNPIGDKDFGTLSTGKHIDIDGIHLDWFDRHLRGEGGDEMARVRLFVMGGPGWREYEDWPIPGTDNQRWHLHSAGRANSAAGDGSLSVEPPTAEPPDTYDYDPRDPVPTVGGQLCCNMVHALGGPQDQREVEQRDDILVYTSTELGEPLDVIGPVEMRLVAASSAVDTDFTAKLVDVAPCGYATILSDGIIRARFRNSMSEEALLTPDEPTEYRIEMGPTAHRFNVGHRVRLEISSSNFPRFDRNPNTGELPGLSDRHEIARQTVFHSSEYPSFLILPVLR